MGEERLGLDRSPRDHRRGDALPPARVRQADHRDVGHRGVIAQHRLHLGRAHVLAPRDDDLLQAARDEEVAAAVEQTPGPRVEPAAAQCLAGGRRIVEVAAHHSRTAADDLPARFRQQGASVGIHDGQLDALVRAADRPRPEERVPADGHGEPVGALRLSVRLDDLGTGEPHGERLLHLDRVSALPTVTFAIVVPRPSPGCARRGSTIAGTSGRSVTPWRSITATSSPTSKVPRTIVPPVTMRQRTWETKIGRWQSGLTTAATDSAASRRVRATVCAAKSIPSWVISTPFGSPVVPDVKAIAASPGSG